MNVFLLIFVAVTLGSLGLFHLLLGRVESDSAAMRKRLRETFRPAVVDPAAKALYKNIDVLNLNLADEYALVRDEMKGESRISWNGFQAYVASKLQQAALTLTPSQFCYICLASALFMSLAGVLLLRWIGLLLGFGGGAIMPLFVLYRLGKLRRDKFLRQLPQAFEMMARVIRSGQSVSQALQAVADAFAQPIAGIFASCQQQQSLGVAPETVFQDVARRAGVLEFRIFVMALAIQRQTGGNLSELLDRMSLLIRNRLRLRQQIRALTADGRLQGITLSVLPFVVFGAMLLVNRNYADVLLEQKSLLAGTLAVMVVGMIWVNRIVNFDS